MKQEHYKGYLIVAESRPLDDQWRPQATVSWYEGDTLIRKRLDPSPPLTYPTEEEANNYALEMGRVFIDGHDPIPA